MGIKELFVLQFIAHLILDYFFQTDKLAKQKNEIGFKSPFLYWHALLCFALSWLFSLQVGFVMGAVIIAISHFLADGFKHNLNNSKTLVRYAYFIDQAFHIGVIALVVCLFQKWHGIHPVLDITIDFKYLLIITGYLVCLKPANIFIKEVVKSTKTQVSSDNEMPNAGKVIGVLERILTLTLILVSQYSAVGFFYCRQIHSPIRKS